MGSVNVGTPSGQGSHYKYPARLNFTDMGFTIEFSSAIGVDLTGQLGGNMVVLVGRDILAPMPIHLQRKIWMLHAGTLSTLKH